TAALCFTPWFARAAWLAVLPEYAPYKYNSFPVNAANQIYHLTGALQDELGEAQKVGAPGALPRTIVFQSIVDATVSASDVVADLLARLPASGHELVVF